MSFQICPVFFRFFAVNVLITYLYLSTFQKVDEEEYGGLTEILKEGLMTSFSSFLVSTVMIQNIGQTGLANSVDLDQMVQLGQGLPCLPFRLHPLDS